MTYVFGVGIKWSRESEYSCDVSRINNYNVGETLFTSQHLLKNFNFSTLVLYNIWKSTGHVEGMARDHFLCIGCSSGTWKDAAGR